MFAESRRRKMLGCSRRGRLALGIAGKDERAARMEQMIAAQFVIGGHDRHLLRGASRPRREQGRRTAPSAADGAYVVLMPVQHPSRLRPLRPDELTIEGAELELKLD